MHYQIVLFLTALKYHDAWLAFKKNYPPKLSKVYKMLMYNKNGQGSALLTDRWLLIPKQPQRCSIKKGVLKNFAGLTRKHLRQSLFLTKVTGYRAVHFGTFSKSTFFTEHFWTTASVNCKTKWCKLSILLSILPWTNKK